MVGGDGDIPCENPRIIVNGFIWTGITGALDGIEENTLESEPEEESDSEERGEF